MQVKESDLMSTEAGLRAKLEAEGRLDPVADDDAREGSLCEPRTGSCVGHRRLVPCFLVDIAGLVPGASEGRGRGNAFLADLANCNALKARGIWPSSSSCFVLLIRTEHCDNWNPDSNIKL